MSAASNQCLALVLFLLMSVAGATRTHAATEERSVAPFSRLSVRDGIDVELTQASTAGLRVEAEDIELERVLTTIEGDELILSIEGGRGLSFFEQREVTVALDFVQLTAIDARGGSDIEGRNDLRFDTLSVHAAGGSDIELVIEADNVEFDLSGGSDLDVRGSATSVVIEASGGSDIAAASLDSERATLKLSGGSDASIRASVAVTVDATGGSDVSIRGNPPERTIHNDRSSDIAWR